MQILLVPCHREFRYYYIQNSKINIISFKLVELYLCTCQRKSDYFHGISGINQFLKIASYDYAISCINESRSYEFTCNTVCRIFAYCKLKTNIIEFSFCIPGKKIVMYYCKFILIRVGRGMRGIKGNAPCDFKLVVGFPRIKNIKVVLRNRRINC